jgi:hypothetical protein
VTVGALIVDSTGGDGDDCNVRDEVEDAVDEIEDATEDRGVNESKLGERL